MKKGKKWKKKLKISEQNEKFNNKWKKRKCEKMKKLEMTETKMKM